MSGREVRGGGGGERVRRSTRRHEASSFLVFLSFCFFLFLPLLSFVTLSVVVQGRTSRSVSFFSLSSLPFPSLPFPSLPFSPRGVAIFRSLPLCIAVFLLGADPPKKPSPQLLIFRYFVISHRNETRGLGGIFFDDLNDKVRTLRCEAVVLPASKLQLPVFLFVSVGSLVSARPSLKTERRTATAMKRLHLYFVFSLRSSLDAPCLSVYLPPFVSPCREAALV